MFANVNRSFLQQSTKFREKHIDQLIESWKYVVTILYSNLKKQKDISIHRNNMAAKDFQRTRS